MARVGRKDKLTPQRENIILNAMRQVGVTQEEAARLAGITDRTLNNWKVRAREALSILPADWKKQDRQLLEEWMDDLGIEMADVVPTGKGGKPIKRDLVAAIQLFAGKYRDFFERLERAMLEGEMSTMAELRAMGSGGRWKTNPETGEQEWHPIQTIKEKQVPILDEKGNVVGWRAKYRDVTTLGPNDRVLRFIAERRYRRFSPRRAVDPSQTSTDPVAVATQIHRALRDIEETVPSAD